MSGSSLTAKVAIIEASLERRECLLSLSLDAGERDPSDGYEDRRLAADAVSLDEVQAGRANLGDAGGVRERGRLHDERLDVEGNLRCHRGDARRR